MGSMEWWVWVLVVLAVVLVLVACFWGIQARRRSGGVITRGKGGGGRR